MVLGGRRSDKLLWRDVDDLQFYGSYGQREMLGFFLKLSDFSSFMG